MMMFLVLKERLKSFYGKYATPVNGVIKFLYSLAAMALLNGNIGYRTELTGPVALLAVALVSAFLPYGAIGCLLGAVMLAHIYAVSMETALITAVILIILILLYYGFQPGDSFWLVLTPMAFLLKIPFAVPLLAGLAGSLLTVIPVGSGVVIYYIISYVKQNAGVLTNDASVDITQKFVQIIRGLLSSQEMMVMIMVCVVGILCVYLLHNMSLDYAWEIAIVTGTIAQLAAVFVGDFIFHVSMPVPKQHTSFRQTASSTVRRSTSRRTAPASPLRRTRTAAATPRIWTRTAKSLPRMPRKRQTRKRPWRPWRTAP